MTKPADQPRPVGEGLTALQRQLDERTGGRIVPWEGPSIEVEVRAKLLERWQAFVPRRFWEASVDDLEPEAAEAVAEWNARRPLPNLVVTGPVGTGKTHLAIAAIRPWHAEGARVMYAPVADLMASLRPGGDGRDAFERASHVDILVLDDLGAVRDSEWTDEMLYRLVDARWRAGRAVIATTNLDLPSLAGRVGARVYERLCLSGAILIQVGGESRRRDNPHPEQP